MGNIFMIREIFLRKLIYFVRRTLHVEWTQSTQPRPRLSHYNLLWSQGDSVQTVSVEVTNTSGNTHKVGRVVMARHTSNKRLDKIYNLPCTIFSIQIFIQIRKSSKQHGFYLKFIYLKFSGRDFTNRGSNSLTFQILLENLTTNMMYSLRIQGSSESLYSPGITLVLEKWKNLCHHLNPYLRSLLVQLISNNFI